MSRKLQVSTVSIVLIGSRHFFVVLIKGCSRHARLGNIWSLGHQDGDFSLPDLSVREERIFVWFESTVRLARKISLTARISIIAIDRKLAD